MELTIRQLNENDYQETLVDWWKEWGWTAPEKDFLPDNGMGGYIVYDGEIPICAGFISPEPIFKMAWRESSRLKSVEEIRFWRSFFIYTFFDI
jgi:hypothetical protein